MVPYRLYLVGSDDHFVGVEDANCPDDNSALARAALSATESRAVEVWSGARLVGRVPVHSCPTPDLARHGRDGAGAGLALFRFFTAPIFGGSEQPA